MKEFEWKNLCNRWCCSMMFAWSFYVYIQQKVNILYQTSLGSTPGRGLMQTGKQIIRKSTTSKWPYLFLCLKLHYYRLILGEQNLTYFSLQPISNRRSDSIPQVSFVVVVIAQFCSLALLGIRHCSAHSQLNAVGKFIIWCQSFKHGV